MSDKEKELTVGPADLVLGPYWSLHGPVDVESSLMNSNLIRVYMGNRKNNSLTTGNTYKILQSRLNNFLRIIKSLLSAGAKLATEW